MWTRSGSRDGSVRNWLIFQAKCGIIYMQWSTATKASSNVTIKYLRPRVAPHRHSSLIPAQKSVWCNPGGLFHIPFFLCDNQRVGEYPGAQTSLRTA